MSKRKVVSWLFIITSFWMCTDDFSPGKSGGIHGTEDNEMVIVAKKLLEKNGNILSLPNFKKQQVRGIKTRNVSYSTDATPMWEQVRNARYGEEQIVMIPLRGKEEIRSHVYIERDGDYTYQFSKTFSRLVVRTKEESTVAHVMTYLPDAKYAESHVAELDTMGYSPGYIQFEGLVLVSSLNGTFLHGLLYSHGKIVAKLQMPEDHEHTTECTHEHETIRISLNLYSPLSTITRTAYNDGEEKYFCTICKKEYTDCECVIIDGKILYCDKCGAETFNCICDLSICQTCGEEPCTCHTNPNACQDCGAYPCECGGSNGKEENNGENDEKDENGEDNSEEGTQNKEVEMTEEEVRLINAALNLLKQLGIEISDTKLLKC